MTDTTTRSDGAELAQRLIEEVWSKGQLEVIDEIVSEDYVDYFAGEPNVRGREGLKEYVTETRESFPDFGKDIEGLVVNGDSVALRFTATGTHEGEYGGIEPTGKEISFAGSIFFHIDDGEITATYESADMLGLMEQLDAV
ncbi:ester cyclase [Natribaculum luteum]|uniref:Ester cyclase n=1 Tax=Natribaculum luteum TaxID=1586232 RepID=A0ABD5P384_9EURY|nr:ester cyclase [Natribaculum luteum]